MILHCISVNEAEKLAEDFCKSRFPLRFEKANKFIRRKDKLLSIGAGALLHDVLKLSEDNIIIGENGKPEIADGKMFFSISHSGDYSVTASNTSAVGVDIEEMNPDNVSLSTEVFTDDEIQWINNKDKRFYTLWTLKESALKLFGDGLSKSPNSFSVLPLVKGETAEKNGVKIFAKTKFFDGYCVSVCAEAEFDSIDLVFWDADTLLRI